MTIEKRFEQKYPITFREVQKEVVAALNGIPCEDRIVNNWCVPLAALKVLEKEVTTLPYKDLLAVVVEGIKKQNGECKTNGELGNFWNMVQYLASEGVLVDSGDYTIKYLSSLNTNTVDITWPTERPVLYMQTTRVFTLYRKEGRQSAEKVLPIDALKYYLAHNNAYLGKKNVRLYLYKNGYHQLDPVRKDRAGNPIKLTKIYLCLVFDYQKLVDQFGINLSVGSCHAPEEAES